MMKTLLLLCSDSERDTSNMFILYVYIIPITLLYLNYNNMHIFILADAEGEAWADVTPNEIDWDVLSG